MKDNIRFQNNDPLDEAMVPLFVRQLGSWRIRVERNPLPTNQLRSRYERLATKWHAQMKRLMYPAAYQHTLREMSDCFPASPSGCSMKVLECGTGSGTLASAFAGIAPAAFDLTAIDTSPQMLSYAQHRFNTEGINATTHEADVRCLPFADNSFDIVMSAHVLEHLSNPELALAEMTRVTRPGGTIIVYLTRPSLFGLYIHLFWRVHLYSIAEVRAKFREAGLQEFWNVSIPLKFPLRCFSYAYTACKPKKNASRETHV